MQNNNSRKKKTTIAGLPGVSVVTTLHFECRVHDFHSRSGTKDPHAMGQGQKQTNKQKQQRFFLIAFFYNYQISFP